MKHLVLALLVSMTAQALASPNLNHAIKLNDAIEANDIELVKKLVKDRANLDMDIVMDVAIREGNLAAVKLLLSHGATLEPKNRNLSPLSTAVYEGNLEIVKYLLYHGADPDSKFSTFLTFKPLQLAVNKSNLEMVKLLLSYGANPNYKSGTNILEQAILSEDLEIVTILLEHGADPNIRSFSAEILDSAIYVGNPEMVKLLLSFGADPKRMYPVSSLNQIIERGDPEMVKLYISLNPSCLDNHYTYGIIDPEMAKIILRAGATPENLRGSDNIADMIQKVSNPSKGVVKKAETICLKSNLNLLEKVYYNVNKSKYKATERCIRAEIAKQLLK